MPAVILAEVVAVRRLSPHFVTITLGGPAITRLDSGGYDQRFKLLLAPDGRSSPALPAEADWYASYRALPDDVRPYMRTYTVRSQDPSTRQIDVEFALHGGAGSGGPAGPASAWAAAAKPGDKIGVIGPDGSARGRKATVPYAAGSADWQLLVGDDTALPAIASIVEALPADAVARVFVQVPAAGDARALATASTGTTVTWLTGSDDLVHALTEAELPEGTPYAWVAGETALVRRVRDHLLGERGWPKADHYFGGYWRAGVAEGAE